jgi:hypothetical protein
MPRRRFKSPVKLRRPLARRLTLAVAGLHGGLLLTLAVTPEDLPPQIGFFELLWAAQRQEMFYPLLALLLLAPVLTAGAWATPGKHRYYLLAVWAGSLFIGAALFADRISLMLRILWRLAHSA